MSEKSEQNFEALWYVMVHLHGEDCIPDFYICHSSHVAPWLKNDHQSWLEKLERNGERCKDGNLRHFRATDNELSKAKNQWNGMEYLLARDCRHISPDKNLIHLTPS